MELLIIIKKRIIWVINQIVRSCKNIVSLYTYDNYKVKLKEDEKSFHPLTSTSYANLFVFLIFASLLFFFEQTKGMINYGIKNIQFDPIYTTLWILLFSLSIYIFSQSASRFRRDVSEKNKYRIDLLKVIIYFIPILFLVYILISSTSFTFPTNTVKDAVNIKKFIWGLNPISYILLFVCGYTLVRFILKRRTNDHFFKSMRIAILIVTGIISIFYISFSSEFTGRWGVAILDIMIIWLIWVRIFLYYFYKFYSLSINSPKLIIDGHLNLKRAKYGLFMFLMLMFLYLNFKPTNWYKDVINLKTKTLSSEYQTKRVSLKNYIEEWLAQDSLSCESKSGQPIYLVAGQGGGSRAGYWTASALMQLSQQDSCFLQNCLVISSVSGSSVGATLFQQAHKKGVNLIPSKLNSFFRWDFISQSAVSLLLLNPIQKIIPFVKTDKNELLINQEGDEFENLISGDIVEHNSVSYKSELYSDSILSLITSENLENTLKQNIPLILYNSYNISTKKKSVISPVQIYGQKTEATQIEYKDSVAYEDFLYPLLDNDESISLGQAVNLSQMFPIMSTSNIYGTDQYYDGGVYDNSGLSTIRDVYSILAPLRDSEARDRKIVILYLQNSVENQSEDVSKSALSALIKAASGSIFSANPRKHIAKLRREVNKYGDYFNPKQFINEEEVTLNRWLSQEDMRKMNKALEKKVKGFVKNNKTYKVRSLHPRSHKVNVYFRSGQDTIDSSEVEKLEEYFKNITPIRISIRGYSDMQYNESNDNMTLAINRAKSVESLLLNLKKIPASDIITLTPRPNEGDNNLLSMQQNRRVEIDFLFYASEKAYFAEKQ